MMLIFDQDTFCPSLGNFNNLAISTAFQENPYIYDETFKDDEFEETPFPIIDNKNSDLFSYSCQLSSLFLPQIVNVI